MLPSSATAPRKKSPEIVELERLYNSETTRRNRDIDPRFLSPRHFGDHSDSELIFSILAYIGLLGGTANKAQDFRGVEGTLHGYSLKIYCDVSRPGRMEAEETREHIEVTVKSFAEAKRFLDEL
jgi:hypothetical protein